MKILTVIGARPQFIKHAAIDFAFKKHPQVSLFTVHTGQHYDKKMSDVFFDELKISAPDVLLSVGSYNHGKQTGLMMIELEEIVSKERPDAILVYGDTNSTLAGALVGSKLHIPIIHIEAGLRSFNKAMPEEINRILTDHVSSLLFAPSEQAISQLKKESVEGVSYLAGDVMYDMIKLVNEFLNIDPQAPYYLATVHRPYNTDDLSRLLVILKEFESLSHPVKFPIHPRTRNILKQNGIQIDSYKNISFMEPQSYIEMMKLLKGAEALITDSGGMQKEAYWMKKKCVTVRSETEWKETLLNGWNTLVFEDLSKIRQVLNTPAGEYIAGLYGDGNAAEDIAGKIIAFLEKK